MASAVDAFSDEVLEQQCLCLPGRELLALAGASRALRKLISTSEFVWSHLSRALLGRPLCRLHETLSARQARPTDAAFWRALFRRGYELRAVRWSQDLRAEFFRNAVGPEGGLEEGGGGGGAAEFARSITTGSGHSTVGIGKLVVKVGGLRPDCSLARVHAAVFNLETLSMYEVALAPDSAEVGRRLRHAACEIHPALTSGSPALLVLGGCDDRTKEPCPGGLRLLHVLELLDDDGKRGRWHSLEMGGQAPRSIWHHVCGSFAKGKRVVVFGGDFDEEDPEFGFIFDRALPAGFVYVLDVDERDWSRVATSGPAPTWRSLHAGLTHRDALSHSERLVILGGCSEHVPIFGSGETLAEMRGHALDLNTFRWLAQPAWGDEGEEGSSHPAARLRFAAEKFGEWLLLYGGHGTEQVGETASLHKLNLKTLKWSSAQVFGRERRHAAAPAATMTAGLVVGGVQFTWRVAPVPKLDVLTLCSATDSEEEHPADEAGEAQDDGSSSSSSSDEQELIQIVVRDGSGAARRTVIPRFLLRRLLAGQERREDREDGEETEDRGGEAMAD